MINTRGENADLKGREARGETLTQKKTSTLNHNRLQSVTHRQKVRTQSKEGEANRAVLHLEWCPPCPLSRTGPSEPQFSLWSVFTEEALPTVRCTVLHGTRGKHKPLWLRHAWHKSSGNRRGLQLHAAKRGTKPSPMDLKKRAAFLSLCCFLGGGLLQPPGHISTLQAWSTLHHFHICLMHVHCKCGFITEITVNICIFIETMYYLIHFPLISAYFHFLVETLPNIPVLRSALRATYSLCDLNSSFLEGTLASNH